MKNIKCYDIEWDTETEDGIEAPELPSEVEVEIDEDDFEGFKDDSDALDDIICDKLSDKIGWLVKAFSWKEA